MPIDPDILARAQQILSQRRTKIDPEIVDRAVRTLQYGQSEQSKIDKWAKGKLDNAMIPGLAAVAEGIGTRAASLVTRPFNEELADRLQRMGGAIQREMDERDPSFLRRNIRGAATTIPTMVLGGMAGGPVGAIGVSAMQTADSAYTEAKDAGLTKRHAARHALTQGALEGGIAGLFQVAGLGGAEKIFSKGATKAANVGLKQGLKNLGMTGLHEWPEEMLTSLSQNVASAMDGVNKRAMDWEHTKATIQDTTLQTALVTLALGSPGVVRAAQAGKFEKAQKALDEMRAAAEAGQVPSREKFKEWGFSPVNSPSGPARQAKVAETLAEVDRALAGREETAQAEQSPETELPPEAPPESPEAAEVQPETPETPEAQPGQPAEPVEPEGPAEPIVPPENAPVYTSVKNAMVDEIREDRGDTPIAAVPAESQVEWLEAAERRIAENPDLPGDLVSELRETPRNLSDEETAVLQLHYRKLNNDFAALADSAYGENASPEAQAEAQRVLTKLQAVEEAARAAGREWGRAGVARQIVLKSDFSLASLMRRATVAKGEALTPEEAAKIKEESDSLEQEQAKLERKQKALAEQDSTAGVDEEIESVLSTMLDGKKASQWMRSALEARAQRLGIHVGMRSREKLVQMINEAEGIIRDEAERNDIPYRLLLEGIDESYPAIAEYANLERTAKDRGHSLTGLSQGDVRKLVNNGFDYSSNPDKVGGQLGQKLRFFDDYAQQIANEFPDLFNTWESPSEVLWNMLAIDIPTKIRWDSPRVMEAGVAWVQQNASNVSEEDLPPIKSMEIPQQYIGEDPKASPKTRGRAKAKEKFDAAWAKFYETLRKGQEELGGGAGSLLTGESGAMNLELLADGVELVKASVELGVATFTEFWSKAKVNLGDAAENAKETLREVWDKAVEAGLVVKPSIDPDDHAAIRKMARKLTRAVVESGVIDRDAVVDAVHKELAGIVPGITRRMTMDAISGYGDFSELSKEDVDVAIRDIRGQLQQLAKLEDMAAGRAPKKTGVERRTPSDEERQLIQQVNEAKKRGGFDVLDPARQLKSALGAAKTAIKNRISDLEHEIRTREKIVKERTPLQPDAELEALRKRLNELREEHAEVFPKQGQTEAQRIAATEKSLDRAITQLEAELEGYLATGDLKKKGSAKPVTSPAIESKRAQLTSLRSVRAELKDIMNPKLSAEEKRTAAYKRSLEKRLADLERRIAEEDFSKKPINKITPDKEITEAKHRIEEHKKTLKEMEERLRRNQLKGIAKVVDVGRETLDASRAIMTSMDLSAVLRQGGFAVYSHPVMAAKAAPVMFKAWASAKGEFEVMEEIRSRENARLYETAKLYMSSSDSLLSRHEEVFRGSYWKKIPGVSASGRAYVAFLNRMRADLFDSLHATLRQSSGEVSEDQAKAIANFVNVVTGRGDLGRYAASAEALSTIFFAPRYMVSRFQVITMQPLRKSGDMATGKLLAKEYGRALVGLGTFYGALAIAAAFALDDEEQPQFEFDPRSTDFGKVRFGDTIIDPLAGLSQTAVLLGRAATLHTKMSTGEIVPLVGKDRPHGGLTFTGAVGKFLQYKLAPAPAAATELWTGEDTLGRPSERKWTLVRNFSPLSFGDIYEVMTDDKGIPKKAALSALVVFGAGVNRYQNATPERFAEKIAEHPRLRGRKKGTRKEFDYERQVSQVVRQAKKRGLSEGELATAIGRRLREEGAKPETIRKYKTRLRGRYRSF